MLCGDTLSLVLMASRGYTMIWLTAPANPPATNLCGPDIKFGSLLIALLDTSKMNILTAVSGMIFKQLTPLPRNRLLMPSCEDNITDQNQRDVKVKQESFLQQKGAIFSTLVVHYLQVHVFHGRQDAAAAGNHLAASHHQRQRRRASATSSTSNGPSAKKHERNAQIARVRSHPIQN
jgi:hypothetical protein